MNTLSLTYIRICKSLTQSDHRSYITIHIIMYTYVQCIIMVHIIINTFMYVHSCIYIYSHFEHLLYTSSISFNSHSIGVLECSLPTPKKILAARSGTWTSGSVYLQHLHTSAPWYMRCIIIIIAKDHIPMHVSDQTHCIDKWMYSNGTPKTVMLQNYWHKPRPISNMWMIMRVNIIVCRASKSMNGSTNYKPTSLQAYIRN